MVRAPGELAVPIARRSPSPPQSPRRRTLTLALLIVLSLAWSVLPAAKASQQQGDEGTSESSKKLVLLLERTDPGPTSFELFVSVSTGGEKSSFIGSLYGIVKDGQLVEAIPGHATSFGRDHGPDSYSSGSSTCYVQSCRSGPSFSFQYTAFDDSDGSDPRNRLFAVAEGSEIDFDFQGEGWKFSQVDWDFRYVDGRDADATGASLLGFGAEVFFEASASGGRHGSVAMAIPPCSGAASGVLRRGAGQVVLEGGEEEKSSTCPPPDSVPQIASWATAKTKWRLAGTMAGDTTLNHTRLFVIDLPRDFPRDRS